LGHRGKNINISVRKENTMAPKTRRDGDNGNGKDLGNTASLTIRDVVLIMAAVVSVVAAWGVYGTRLSLVESSIVTQGEDIKELKETVMRELSELKAEVKSQTEANDAEHKEMRDDQRRFDREQARRKAIVDKAERDFLKK